MVRTENIAYFGYLPDTSGATGGAEVKTKSILVELKRNNVAKCYHTYDTSGWKTKKLSLSIALIRSLLFCDNIIIVSRTAQFLLILRLISPFHKLCKTGIHFIPIGDCKASYFREKDKLRCQTLKGIYVETHTMRDMLVRAGTPHVKTLSNFKSLKAYRTNYIQKGPLRFCYFARVAEEKGILEAIEVFSKVNSERVRCSLDIYGNIEADIQARFSAMLKKHPDFIHYKGCISPNQSPEHLKDYFMMIFPTKVGEGFPGSIIDAFASSLPILSSRFTYFNDILKEKETTISFAIGDFSDMQNKLEYVITHQDEINSMRPICYQEYNKYIPTEAMRPLIEQL